MPWATALDLRERECLLTILQKLAIATGPDEMCPLDDQTHLEKTGAAGAGEPAATTGDVTPA